MKRGKLIIGVDFGTTFTGVSYVMSSTTNVEDVHIIRTWPGHGREADSVWKAPSRLAYLSENPDAPTSVWGYQVTPKMKSYSWMKLLLDRKTPSTDYDDPDLKHSQGEGLLQLPPGTTATEVCGDFLREIYQYTLEYLRKRLTAAVIDITPFEFWMTVPAIWSDAAKAATWEAARMAGFGSRAGDTVNFIPEPEAAAVAALSSMALKNTLVPIHRKEAIVICDCGGGTVDIITYLVKNTEPLEFDELVVGTGGKCGSTFIDRNFHRWMSTNFRLAFDCLPAAKKGPGSTFMKEFELYKHDFGHLEDARYVFEVPLVMRNVTDSVHYDSEESTVKFSREVMKGFFDPAVAKVKQLLKQQFDAVHREQPRTKISKVILVGGFGDSPYLNNQLKSWCLSTENVQLMCPENPQATIVKGAAFRGLQGIKASKKRSRLHYGIQMLCPFREGIDPEEFVEYDPWDDNEKLCSGRAVWKISKGQLIDEKTKLCHEIGVTTTDDQDPSFSADLFSCKSDVPPDYVSDLDVDVVGTLHLEFSEADLRMFKRRVIDGLAHWRLEYELQIFLAPSDGLLHVRAVTTGNKEVGVTTLRYDSEMM